MHRTIEQNKILRIIRPFLFVCLANIYRPSLGKVQLGRPNPKPLQPLNFYLRKKKKKTILLRIVCTTTYWSQIFNFYFHLFFLKILKICIRKPVNFFFAYNNYSWFFVFYLGYSVVKSLLISMQFISPHCNG